ncbi:uncharacterized protein B0H18DRAFT_541101 [Fomitopsis serialis]|uniref:uncharacterized protein n=1 Tax=Fomitopsis serialis TaxID=139415 RepID=UPI0020072DB3|nr:uncharacterized protein B0H18DRAFT_541101 [Neoantrodia serialis]KAH9921609.1 hypothetical protein B0H18DRAFT_541101 [Neoantrodia serialis]
MAPDRRIAKPHNVIERIYTGSRCFLVQMRVSQAELAKFRTMMHRSIDAHLDISKTFTAQDPKRLERHYAEVARVWKAAEKYEDAWPIRAYTSFWVNERRKQKGKTRAGQDEGHPRVRGDIVYRRTLLVRKPV